jgi:GNAT superfamily N-acetyltransferase
VEILEVDGPSAPEELLRELYEAELDAVAELQHGAAPPAFEARLHLYRDPGRRRWLARLDGLPAGAAELRDGVADVRVRRSRRRRGVGTALFAAVCAAAAGNGLRELRGHHATQGGAAFAASVGATDERRDVESLLVLAEAELPEAAAPEGVELRTSRSVTAGHETLTTVAVAGGEVVASTSVRIGGRGYAGTDDTATVPAWRGRGLAQLVKCENLRRLREERPDVEVVGTVNAEQNTAIRTVNAKIGFVPVLILTTTVMALGSEE